MNIYIFQTIKYSYLFNNYGEFAIMESFDCVLCRWWGICRQKKMLKINSVLATQLASMRDGHYPYSCRMSPVCSSTIAVWLAHYMHTCSLLIAHRINIVCNAYAMMNNWTNHRIISSHNIIYVCRRRLPAQLRLLVAVHNTLSGVMSIDFNRSPNSCYLNSPSYRLYVAYTYIYVTNVTSTDVSQFEHTHFYWHVTCFKCGAFSCKIQLWLCVCVSVRYFIDLLLGKKKPDSLRLLYICVRQRNGEVNRRKKKTNKPHLAMSKQCNAHFHLPVWSFGTH